MSSMRRFQRIIMVIAASLWLATSSFAQIHMTMMLASHAGMADHPAMPMAHERDAQFTWANDAKIIVVDAAVFWDAVDHYEGTKEQSASCPFFVPALLAGRSESVAPQGHAVMVSARLEQFASRSSPPDTPPPRG